MKVIHIILWVLVVFALGERKRTSFSDTVFSSKKDKVVLLELFTSEGCSSCPPAEKWFNQLQNHKQLWTQFIPLVFHVDYWDRLGWKDPFSLAGAAERQRRYAHLNHISGVYTPGVLLDGVEWRDWRKKLSSRLSLSKTKDTIAGVLQISIEKKHFTAEYFPAGIEEDLQENLWINFVLLGFNLKSNVIRGENAGKMLKHNFVVLDWVRLPMKEENKRFFAKMTAERFFSQSGKNSSGIAGWVSSPNSPHSIQATGGSLH